MKSVIKKERKMLDVSVVMPCRNEEAAVAGCIKSAKQFIEDNDLKGEIIVVDNASADASARIAKAEGARVIRVYKPGYGRTLRAGIRASRGRIIIMGDCDTTYDFKEAIRLYRPMNEDKYDMMIGDRFKGGIKRGAMPMSHKIGVRLLSLIGRIRFKTDIRDFHCGLRGLTGEAAARLKFKTTGMEFASEMIGVAVKKELRIGQTPVTLSKVRVKRKSKLHAVRDGLRHLRYIVNYR
ncbi:MAG: glycosyltransferase family 2 protein [Lachnospiraceae bacterium]|nr:glycosyltransferase family 2 protein [Lachnospiraceae bacterium]